MSKCVDVGTWVENKKNRTIVMIVVVVLVVIALAVRLVSQVKGMVVSADFPDSGLLAEPGEYKESVVPYYLTESVTNPDLGITMAVLPQMGVEDDYMVIERDEVVYVVGESQKDIRTLCEEDLYKYAVKAVMGYTPKVTIREISSGYLNNFAAEYATASLKAKISTKTIPMHSICYRVSLEEFSGVSGKYLILYACSEDVSKLQDAQVILKEMCLSIREVDPSFYEVKEEDREANVFHDYFYPIDVYWMDDSDGYANSVMLITWENMFDKPGELTVYGPDGQKGVLNEEFTLDGHYLYEFGITRGGEYRLVGGTDVQLTGVEIWVTSMENYINELHYFDFNDDIPEHILNRADEEE